MEVSKFNISKEELKEYFDNKVSEVVENEDLIAIFNIAFNSTNFSLFPKINGNGDYRKYIDKWIELYVKAKNRSSLNYQASPKTSASDPSVMKIVKTACGLTDEEVEENLKVHNLFMSAENIQGYLLEEYIASVVAPHGLLYCAGNLLRSVDFCSSDGTLLLQIKNKSNTENSSSSAIRAGTSIQKWYRLGTKTIRGEKHPVYKWKDLNDIITNYSGSPCEMTEEGYIQFIHSVVSVNQNIITDN